MADDPSTRARIRQTVLDFPGIHLRGIVRALDLSTALARYHLDALRTQGEIRVAEVGGFVRYFPATTYREMAPRERKVLNILRQERPLEIVMTLLEMGPMQHRDLHEILGGSKATLTYHLDKLVGADIVEKVARGENRGFHLRNPEAVRDILRRFEPAPSIAMQVHDVWEDLFSGHRKRSDKNP